MNHATIGSELDNIPRDSVRLKWKRRLLSKRGVGFDEPSCADLLVTLVHSTRLKRCFAIPSDTVDSWRARAWSSAGEFGIAASACPGHRVFGHE